MDLMLGIICSHVATTHFTQDQEQGQYIVNSRNNLLHLCFFTNLSSLWPAVGAWTHIS